MVGVGMPQWLHLNLYGRLIRDAYGHVPYLVGSAAKGKQWRDVDVRVMLEPDEYERIVGEGWRTDSAEEPNYYDACLENAKCNGMPTGRRRTAITLAWAALGREMTGLPIDFQFQVVAPPDHYVEEHDGEPRVPLGGVVGDYSSGGRR